MQWLSLITLSCLRCKYCVPPSNHQWTDLAKCTRHGNFAEQARKNETQCGIQARFFEQIE